VLYRAYCRQARTVVVAARWTQRDVIAQYGLPAEKVHVVTPAPHTAPYVEPTSAELDTTRRKLGLPETFVLYPAQTFPHKNHLALLEAIARLRDRHGLNVPLVCSGRKNDFYSQIERRIRALHLESQVFFPGFVSPLELQCLYRMTRAVVIPTLFEAASGPLWEAFLAERPAACSNVTSLPEQAGGAAIVFDPGDINAIADAVRRLWTDESLRETLVARGRQSVARFTWDSTARHFRALYRKVSGRGLTDVDREILSAPPLL
jgi:glycosyltransferase involved in cell wall biosynthesis